MDIIGNPCIWWPPHKVSFDTLLSCAGLSMCSCLLELRLFRRCYPEVPEMYQKKSRHRILSATFRFRVVPLGVYTSIATFLPRSEAVLEVLWYSVFGTFCDLAWIYLQCQICAPSTLFSSWRRGRSNGLNEARNGVGDDRHVYGGQKLLHNHSCVGGRIVEMEQPVRVPFVCGHFRHVLPKLS